MSGENRNDLEVEEDGDMTIVRFPSLGKLDESNLRQIGEELFLLADRLPRPNMVLDFEGVVFISSAALGMLIRLHLKVLSAGGWVSFRHLNKTVLGIFVSTGLDDVFGIGPDPGDDEWDGGAIGMSAPKHPPKPSGGVTVSLSPPNPEMGC